MTKFFFSTFLFMSSFSFAQTTPIEYMTDKRTNCKVVFEKYWEADQVIWNGNCKSNLADGKGTLSWYQNQKLTAKYVGEMKEGNPNGKGEYFINNYGTMTGNFVNGWLEGEGKMTFPNGGKTEGNFSNGEFLNLDKKYLAQLQKVKSNIKDATNLYNFDNSDELFYYALVPKGNIKAVLVLLPSTSESAESVVSCNRQLMQNCYDNNILSVVLSVNFNDSMVNDKTPLNFFNTTFEEIINKFKAPKDKFILSGLSLGGNNALQYTEMSRNPQYKTTIKPIAVIGVDPPVDEEDMYYRAKEALDFYKNNPHLLTESIQIGLNESKFLLDLYQKSYNGSPSEFPEKYIESSIFSRSQPDGGNAKFLLDVPVRLYTDPDIIWNLKNKNRDYYHMNAASLSAMTNVLMMKGNKKAEFIPALGKGYRIDGTRHPHSWSIVDPDDCIKWILEIIK